MSAAPPASAVTPALIEAAKKEGKVVWYTSVDLKLSEQIGKAFEAKYPGVACKVERTGAERLLQRIGQEYSANVHAVDVVNSSDASHLVYWKDKDMLAAYVPEDVAKFYPAEHKDADGMFASFRVFLCVIAYNTNLVKKEEAPKSFADLLDPKWKGKIVKAHPGYSGTIMTATYQISRDLGWGYFEKLAQQNILQVQSAADPPKKLALGERAIQADGVEYLILQEKESGQPVEPVYATEGTPLIVGPNGLFKAAPNPNAARLFQSFSLLARVPAALHRHRRLALGASAGQGKGRPHAAQRDQADEGRCGGGAEDGRRDQGALRQDVPCVSPSRSAMRLRLQVGGGTIPVLPYRPGFAADDRERIAMTTLHPAPVERRRLGFDLTKPVLLAVRGYPVRADRDAAVVAGLSTPSPTRRRVHRRQFRSAGVGRRLSRPAAHHLRARHFVGADLLRGGGADGLAGSAHRHAAAPHRAPAGDGLVRHAAVPRRHRLGAAGGAQ